MHEDSEAACGNQVWRGREWAGKFDKPRCVSVGGHFCMQRGTGERRTIFEPARYICVVRAEPARAPPARPSAALIYFMYAPLFQEHATNLKLITMSKSLCNKRADTDAATAVLEHRYQMLHRRAIYIINCTSMTCGPDSFGKVMTNLCVKYEK